MNTNGSENAIARRSAGCGRDRDRKRGAGSRAAASPDERLGRRDGAVLTDRSRVVHPAPRVADDHQRHANDTTSSTIAIAAA
jgi:hypothetical protein